MRTGIAALSYLAVTIWAMCASAQADGSAQADEEARHRFEAGARAYAEGRYEQALEDFREAYRLSVRPELLNNIGETADRLHLDREALDAFEQYLADMTAAGHPIMNRARVENRIRALRAQLGAPQDPAAATPAPGGDPALLGSGIAVAVLGAIATAFGIVGLVMREDSAIRYNSDACDPTLDQPSSEVRCGDVRSDGETWGTAGGVLLAAGAAAIVGGAVLLVVGLTSDSTQEVSISCAPSLAGIVCAGRF